MKKRAALVLFVAMSAGAFPRGAAAQEGVQESVLCPSDRDVRDQDIDRGRLRAHTGRATLFVSPYMTLATQFSIKSRCMVVDSKWCAPGADFSAFDWRMLTRKREAPLEHMFVLRNDGACEYQVRAANYLLMPYSVWQQAMSWQPSGPALAGAPGRPDQTGHGTPSVAARSPGRPVATSGPAGAGAARPATTGQGTAVRSMVELAAAEGETGDALRAEHPPPMRRVHVPLPRPRPRILAYAVARRMRVRRVQRRVIARPPTELVAPPRPEGVFERP